MAESSIPFAASLPIPPERRVILYNVQQPSGQHVEIWRGTFGEWLQAREAGNVRHGYAARVCAELLSQCRWFENGFVLRLDPGKCAVCGKEESHFPCNTCDDEKCENCCPEAHNG